MERPFTGRDPEGVEHELMVRLWWAIYLINRHSQGVCVPSPCSRLRCGLDRLSWCVLVGSNMDFWVGGQRRRATL